MIEIIAQITCRGGKPFTAGLGLWDDKVVETAPILRRMKGWSRDRVRDYCIVKNWQVSVVRLEDRKDIDAKGRAAEELRRVRQQPVDIRRASE